MVYTIYHIRFCFKSFNRPQDVGHFFLAMKPDLFESEAEHSARMDTQVQRVCDCPKEEGVTEILLPGEPEAREETRRKSGIPYSANEVAVLQEEAAKAGVPPLAV